MKRIFIALGLLAFNIIFCGYSLFKVTQIHTQMTMHLDEIVQAAEEENDLLLEHHIEDLQTYWISAEDTLLHFVRHNSVDIISGHMAQLEPLAQYKNYGELLREVSVIRWQIQHTWQSEWPTLDNLL